MSTLNWEATHVHSTIPFSFYTSFNRVVLICLTRDGGWHIGVIAVVRSQSRAAICYVFPSFLRSVLGAVSSIKHNSDGRDAGAKRLIHHVTYLTRKNYLIIDSMRVCVCVCVCVGRVLRSFSYVVGSMRA